MRTYTRMSNSFQMHGFNSLLYKTVNYFSFIAQCMYKWINQVNFYAQILYTFHQHPEEENNAIAKMQNWNYVFFVNFCATLNALKGNVIISPINTKHFVRMPTNKN